MKQVFLLLLSQICFFSAYARDLIPVPGLNFLIAQAEKIEKKNEAKKKSATALVHIPAHHPCLEKKNPVCRYIHTLSPSMPLDDAMKLSNSFSKVAKEYKFPPQLLLSIAWQESAFRLNAVRNVNGLVNDNGVYKFSTVGSDFCMMQINALNIKNLDMDPNRLLTDPEYCLTAGAKILTYAKKFESKDRVTGKKWWTRYNAVNDMHRKNYEQAVMRHWRKLDPQGDVSICQVDTTMTPASPFQSQ